MNDSKKYTITAALPYANGPLHLGHLAGAYLPADIFARFLRLAGKDVAFICGSDEHGAAITMRAKKEGRSPREIIDTYHILNKNSFERLGISFDIFHRTSDPLHFETAQGFFKTLYEKGGELEEQSSEQYFDEKFGQFLADRFIVGECPKCGNPEAYGDQCERCGSDLSPNELINPRSMLSGEKPVKKETKHWYFKLEKHADWLRAWLKDGILDGKQHHNPAEWRNHVVGQCLSWLDGGLQPRAITRDLDWGIPVPLDTDDAKGKVLYVWFDAPIGYISATRQWAADQGKNWEEYWKGDDVELFHFIGKDNIVFHCIVFPSMLHAHGGYTLPKNVPANQFLNFEGRKFSKSKGWGIEQHQYLDDFQDFENKEDALRYYLIKSMPEQKDGDFKWDEFTDAHDNELVANLGNFVNRVLTFTNNWFDSKVPHYDPSILVQSEKAGHFVTPKEFLSKHLYPSLITLETYINKFEFKNALKALMDISTLGNQFLQNNAPWEHHKHGSNPQMVTNVISLSLQIVSALSVVSSPFLPYTSQKLRTLLYFQDSQRDLKGRFVKSQNKWPALPNQAFIKLCAALQKGDYTLKPERKIRKAKILFEKINNSKNSKRKDIVEVQKRKITEILKNEREEALLQQHDPRSIKNQIPIEEFEKLDIRIGKITQASKVVKSHKLLNLTIDLGFEQRTVVSGIAKYYRENEVLDKYVALIANLPERNIQNITSQGMVLTAEKYSGELSLLRSDKVVAKGSPIFAPEEGSWINHLAIKPDIVFEDFEKLDLRTGTIVAAARVEKADKLLQLTVDLGFEQRTIVSGIAQHYAPEQIVGKTVVLIANLPPRKLRGIVSQGMILTAEGPDGSLSLLEPEKFVGKGSGIK